MVAEVQTMVYRVPQRQAMVVPLNWLSVGMKAAFHK